MAGPNLSEERRPDLPGLPPNLSVDQLARVERFLGVRDVRRAYDDHLADFLGPPDGDGADALVGSDAAIKSGEVLTVSGHRAHAVLVLEAVAPFEHWDTMFLFPIFSGSHGQKPLPVGRWETVVQSEEGFAPAVASLKGYRPYADMEPFPLAYRYFDPDLWGEDPHVDAATGWSENGHQVMDEVVRRALQK